MDDILDKDKPEQKKLDSQPPAPLSDPKNTHSGMPPVVEPLKRDSDISNLKNQHKSTRMGMPKVVAPLESDADPAKLKNQKQSTAMGLPGIVVADDLDPVNPPPLKKPNAPTTMGMPKVEMPPAKPRPATTMGMPKIELPPIDDEEDAVATKVVKNPMTLLNEEEAKKKAAASIESKKTEPEEHHTNDISQTIDLLLSEPPEEIAPPPKPEESTLPVDEAVALSFDSQEDSKPDVNADTLFGMQSPVAPKDKPPETDGHVSLDAETVEGPSPVLDIERRTIATKPKDESTPATPEKKSSGTGRIIALIAALALVIVSIGSGLYYFKQSSATASTQDSVETIKASPIAPSVATAPAPAPTEEPLGARASDQGRNKTPDPKPTIEKEPTPAVEPPADDDVEIVEDEEEDKPAFDDEPKIATDLSGGQVDALWPATYRKERWRYATLNPYKAKEIAAQLKSCNGRIHVYGHSDGDGDTDYNNDISTKRAKLVRKVLIEKYSLAPDNIVAKGIGASNPAHSNNTEKGRAANRRVTITCD